MTRADASAASIYDSSLAHILAELERLDLLIQRRVARSRTAAEADAQFMGLTISEQEIDTLLARPAGAPRFTWESDQEEAASWRTFDEWRAETKRRAKCSSLEGIRLRLDDLTQVFELDDYETDLVLLCLGPELDLRYERLYAYLQDDVTKRRPSVDVLLSLLARSFAEKVRLRAVFTPQSRLLRNSLVQLFDDPSQPNPPLLARYARLDPRITEFLLGSDVPDVRALPYVSVGSSLRFSDLILHPDERARLERFAGCQSRDGEIIYLHGPAASGKRMVAEAICAERNVPVLLIAGEKLLEADPTLQMLALVVREARLMKSAVFWDGFDQLIPDDKQSLRRMVMTELSAVPKGAFVAGESMWEPAQERLGITFLRFEVTRASAGNRKDLWNRRLQDLPTQEPDAAGLAAKFRFTAGQIHAAAANAMDLARARDPEKPLIGNADLHEACRLQSSSRLSSLARKIQPHYRWDDLVLPPDRIEQLREICACVNYRPQVFSDWGFDRKLSLGKGLNVLFAGPPGTGKTMAAEVIASDLGLDLYKIDLSTVVSKYIGDTEKNLSRVFTEAENSHAILFFDEADALFGKRSEVKDSHDRYANIEIGYLLQKTEEYEGIVILATNLRKNMDDAFVRRMHSTIDFPFPDERDRRRIWQQVWPRETPVDGNLDLDSLARRFAVTGANIRNIAVAAAFAAVQEGVVRMPHVLHATRREYQKMGKVVSDGEFGLHRVRED